MFWIYCLLFSSVYYCICRRGQVGLEGSPAGLLQLFRQLVATGLVAVPGAYRRHHLHPCTQRFVYPPHPAHRVFLTHRSPARRAFYPPILARRAFFTVIVIGYIDSHIHTCVRRVFTHPPLGAPLVGKHGCGVLSAILGWPWLWACPYIGYIAFYGQAVRLSRCVKRSGRVFFAGTPNSSPSL